MRTVRLALCERRSVNLARCACSAGARSMRGDLGRDADGSPPTGVDGEPRDRGRCARAYALGAALPARGYACARACLASGYCLAREPSRGTVE